jgi:hypothetical protein
MAGPFLTDVSFNDDRVPISNKEKGTGYFSDAFNGRPRLLSVDSNPNAAAILACHSSAPKGCCRFTHLRSVVRREKGLRNHCLNWRRSSEDRGVKLGCGIARTRADEEGTGEQWFFTPFSIPVPFHRPLATCMVFLIVYLSSYTRQSKILSAYSSNSMIFRLLMICARSA